MPNLTLSNPSGAPKPGSLYSHTARIAGGADRLVLSGQVGIAPDGTVPADAKGQIAQALANVKALLAGHGLSYADLAKVTVFLTDPADVPEWRAQRDAAFAGHAPTSTLLIVAGLASSAYRVEIEGEAVFP